MLVDSAEWLPPTYMFPMPIVPAIVARMYEVRDGHVSRPSSAFAGGGARKSPTFLSAFIFDTRMCLTSGLLKVSTGRVSVNYL